MYVMMLMMMMMMMTEERLREHDDGGRCWRSPAEGATQVPEDPESTLQRRSVPG